MIDCSHANSQKKHSNQPIVAADIAKQLAAGDTRIRGVMVESHLNEGAQKLDPGKTDPATLKYGHHDISLSPIHFAFFFIYGCMEPPTSGLLESVASHLCHSMLTCAMSMPHRIP